ncbi:MAG: DNA repair protein RecN [Deltaproteobacteria bacterium]|jgi:DNA repair protein RecN (Recombination protein N)|nr:DNA repair protein RecN [Deltaproteobacteria bacterium]
MLQSLHIKDFAIIDELEVEFAPGLNIMTGETGAGKTIIIEALNLVMGSRAQTDLIRSGREKAYVTATFDGARISPELKDHLDRAGIECQDDLIVHRIIGSAGKGRISVNGVPVTGSSLREIAERLVDVSSQHEHQLLLDRSNHVSVLDFYAGHDDLVRGYRGIHQKYVELNCEIKHLENNEREAKEKLEFLKFQFDEIKSADLSPGEDAEIENKRSRLKHSAALEEKSRSVEAMLYGDSGSAIEVLDNSSRLLSEGSRFDVELQKMSQGLERARSEIEDVAREISRYADALDSDPATLEALEERWHLMRGLIRKHGGSIESCLSKADELSHEIDSIANYDEILAQKRIDLENLALDRRSIAKELGKSRNQAATKMSGAVASNLSDLGMGKTSFSIQIEDLSEDCWDESGPSSVEFMLAPNVGEPALPLVKIASGGELSRIMLVLKSALSDKANLASTSIFDEVDSGIGGAVAEVVGKKLKQVSKSKQIICITHLPQVAVYGDSHIKILKQIKAGRTVTKLNRLPADDRVDEIARMLGGEKITDATRAHAVEMIENARKGE